MTSWRKRRRPSSKKSRRGPASRTPAAEPRCVFAACWRRCAIRPGKRVVVLVDEYDKPILDAMKTPETAEANRDDLRGLYATIKDADAYVRFAFLTGVSLFSDLNNLTDLTLDRRYANICGYTDADLDTVFAPELTGLDREEIRRWYNGYNWRGDENVYNPFDVLLLFSKPEFGPYWFETGTPTFLIETLLRRQVDIPSLDGLRSDDALLSRFDVRDMEPKALLFQTGYLTIRGEERAFDGTPLYRLGYPNHEVRRSLSASLLAVRFAGDVFLFEFKVVEQ
ncbi:MAG: AAA family ATPase, partial [Spirochaetaceae bacterium]|nr:AAA family ATPase [Spirochaetaceae bacterium]